MFDKKKFKAVMILKGYSTEKLAEEMGQNPATIYRKMNGTSDFTRKDILQITDILGLDNEQVMDIFFTQELA